MPLDHEMRQERSSAPASTALRTKRPLAHVGARFTDKPVAIWPPKLREVIGAVGERVGIDPKSAVAALDAAGVSAEEIRAGMLGRRAEDREYEVIDGIAVIPVQGTLIKKETWMSAWSGSTSYAEIQRQIAGAADDSGVRGILLDIDSPGGETNGCFELSDFIYSLRGTKPIYAAANDCALSAAYAIASAADKIFVTRTGCVGSIGVYALHAEQAGFDEQLGVKYTYIHNGAKKVDGNPHQPLSETAEADIQAEVDREAGIFHATVARNRNAAEEEIISTQAGLLWADNAIPLLADEVGTIEDALSALQGSLGSTQRSAAATAAIQPKGEAPMAKTVIAAGKEGGGDEMRKCESCGKQAAAADKYCSECGAQIEPDEDDTTKEEGKAAATPRRIPPAAAAPADREAEIRAINNLCKMAGCPDRVGEFLTSKKSALEVSDILTEERSDAANALNVNPRNHKGAGPRIEDIEAEATAIVRQNAGKVTRNLYGTGESPLTKERAYAQALESNPEAYGAFRAQHNAKSLVATLEAAGYSLSPR